MKAEHLLLIHRIYSERIAEAAYNIYPVPANYIITNSQFNAKEYHIEQYYLNDHFHVHENDFQRLLRYFVNILKGDIRFVNLYYDEGKIFFMLSGDTMHENIKIQKA